MISSLILGALVSSCNYQGGFTKARVDIVAHAYGYNLDQYCFAESDLSKSEFKKGYDSGRLHAPKLDSTGILENPKDEASLQSLLDLADKKERDAKQRAEIEALREQIQKQNASLEQLQNETSNLKDEASRIKEDLARKSEANAIPSP